MGGATLIGKRVSRTGALRLGEAEHHGQGHKVSNSGAQIRKKAPRLRFLPLHLEVPLSRYEDKYRGN